tara:strand:- start:6309 stop:6845 length:537 start_codon:yes stop_codon:yes gene_type:complete
MIITNLKSEEQEYDNLNLARIREILQELTYTREWTRYITCFACDVDYVYSNRSHYANKWPAWLDHLTFAVSFHPDIPIDYRNDWNHCLINRYRPYNTLAKHKDDEECLEGSILSISFGGPATFSYSSEYHGPGKEVVLNDLDVMIANEQWFKEHWHSVKNGAEERFNLTFRKVVGSDD